jgi:methionine aminopeptidase
LLQPGVTTDEIDKEVHKMIIDAGAYPSPLGYGGFPKSVLTSVNECICHGIPDSRPLQVHSSFSIICVALFASKILHGLQAECCMLGFKLKLNFLLDCCLLWAYSWHWGESVQDGDIINIDVLVYLNVSPYFVWQSAQAKIYLQIAQSTMLERLL